MIVERFVLSLVCLAFLQDPSSTDAGHAPVEGIPGAANNDARWTPAAPDYAWSFPRDHHAHEDYAVEWWYLTGHLQSKDGLEFGYQFTMFRIGLDSDARSEEASGAPAGARSDPVSSWRARDLVMGHASITDITNGAHVFSDVIYRASPLLGGFPKPGLERLAWCRGPAGTAADWTIEWNGDGFDFSMEDTRRGIAMDLTTHTEKPQIFHGPGGYSQKNASATSASLYYSFTRLQTAGTITCGGETLSVSGQSWMDKEFSSDQLDPDQVGWDWFSLQLDDGRELMLYVLRDANGNANFARGTFVETDGRTLALDPTGWKIEETARWTSEHTGASYPHRWKLSLPEVGLRVEVKPEWPAQENVSTTLRDLYYWEGAVRVLDARGTRIGQGYVELTGYGSARLPL